MSDIVRTGAFTLRGTATGAEDLGDLRALYLDDGPRTARVELGGAGHWVVESGEVDLFAAERTSDGTGRRHHLARLASGSVLPDLSVRDAWQLMVAPLPGGTLRRFDPVAIDRLTAGLAAAARPENFDQRAQLLRLGTSLVRGVNQTLRSLTPVLECRPIPRDAEFLRIGATMAVETGGSVVSDGGTAWITLAGGRGLRCGDEDQPLQPESGHTLIAGRLWLIVDTGAVLHSEASFDLFSRGVLFTAVDQLFAEVLTVLDRRLRERTTEQQRKATARLRAKEEILAEILDGVRGTVAGRTIGGHQSAPPSVSGATWRAMEVLLSSSSVELVAPGGDQPVGTEKESGTAEAARIASASGLRTRVVRLEGRWWRIDQGCLIAVRQGRPVPLVTSRGRYREIDPRTSDSETVTKDTASEYETEALIVYPPCPDGISPKGLAWRSLVRAPRDLWHLLAATVLVAVLGLATPLVLGSTLGDLARTGRASGLSQTVLLLIAAAVVAALVGVLQNVLIVRIEGRTESAFQTALWDRLLRLPTSFFSRHAIGSLTTAVLSIGRIREAMSGLTTQAVAAAVLVLVNTVLLAVVAPPLALIAFGVQLVTGIVTALLGRAVVRHRRRNIPFEQAQATVTHQIFAGLARIKLAAAHDRAYARWAAHARRTQGGTHRMRSVQAVLSAVTMVVPILGQLALFVAVAGPLADTLSTTAFFISMSAYLISMTSMVLLGNAAISAFASLPLLDEVDPVLAEPTEAAARSLPPPVLTGEIELSGVTFTYPGADRPVLDNLSLRIAPGEFVAVVGTSGSGKSTLLRILLGFEQPGSGSVLYDGHELAGLEVTAVRRQLGVVLQNGQLFSGSIRDNICGSGTFSNAEVWRAAEMAGLSDEIGQMPMGMATVVPFGGGTLSFGQRQRVLIARALITKPRILYFDEATSALDNRTQETVTRSTAELAATRVVIAHRLSTIVGADRIIVLAGGRIVQEGTFGALMTDRDGLFHSLAVRQLAGGDHHDRP